jgi:hypothetical protein
MLMVAGLQKFQERALNLDGDVDACRQDDLFPQGALEDMVKHVAETKMP